MSVSATSILLNSKATVNGVSPLLVSKLISFVWVINNLIIESEIPLLIAKIKGFSHYLLHQFWPHDH